MELTLIHEGQKACFHLEGIIDAQGAENIQQHFGKLNLSSLKEVVFNFGKVDYIGSAGIGKLLHCYKDFAALDGKIRIVNAAPSIYDTFKVLNLDRLLIISPAFGTKT